MRKRINLLIALLFIMASVSGQQLKVGGYIFEQKNNEYVARVPFATIYYYNYEDTTKVEFCALTNLLGEYNFYNMRNGKYIVKVVAPGYQTKRQEIQFSNVENLAKNNKNGSVTAHIAMQRINDTQINPAVFQAKDLLLSNDDTLDAIIQRLKAEVSKNGNPKEKKSYRIWIGGVDVDAKIYNELKAELLTKAAKELGDKSLKKTYIEYYDLSGENKTLVDGVFNLVFNGKSRRPAEKSFIPTETTDFFIKK
jgi:hypothetical protein